MGERGEGSQLGTWVTAVCEKRLSGGGYNEFPGFNGEGLV